MKSPSFLWFLFKSLIAATLLVGLSVTHATTYDWFGATNADFSGTTTNWSLGAIPGINDIARWNAAIYTNAPTANANWTVGELLFDAGNTSGVSFDVGVATITLSGNATGQHWHRHSDEQWLWRCEHWFGQVCARRKPILD